MNDLWIPLHRHRRAGAWLGVWLLLAASAAGAQERPAAPPEYGPVSGSFEDVAYPFPVECLPLVLLGFSSGASIWLPSPVPCFYSRFPSKRRW